MTIYMIFMLIYRTQVRFRDTVVFQLDGKFSINTQKIGILESTPTSVH